MHENKIIHKDLKGTAYDSIRFKHISQQPGISEDI